VEDDHAVGQMGWKRASGLVRDYCNLGWEKEEKDWTESEEENGMFKCNFFEM
jgi:hypothetical protein